MQLIPRQITGPVARLGAAAQNALEVARFGGLATGEEPSPYEVTAEQRVYRLRHYYPEEIAQDAPPVLLVPPVMLAAEVYDVSRQTSAVTLLKDHAADPWVVDFGAPEREEGGLERTLADHVIAVSDAIDRVRRATGREVHLAGYSQGGMFCYQAAAYRRSDGLRSLITFGSPVDTRTAVPFGVPKPLATLGAGVLADVLADFALPAWASRTGFRLLDPVKSMRNRIDFILQLHDREALLPREGQRRFLEADGWVAWPGPALSDLLKQFVANNRMMEGGFVVEDHLISLADIVSPILSFVGTVDEIAPPASVRAIRRAAPRAEIYEMALRAGHFGLVVGSTANAETWPRVAQWARWREGAAELPEGLRPVRDDGEAPGSGELVPRVTGRAAYGLELVGGVGSGIARSVAMTASRTATGVREIAREAAGALPRLARLEQIQPSTRISLGLLVSERLRRPEDIFFLFEDRAYTARDINARIDNVVRGLISIGVRQGERVGVLMSARPTALALVVAINRLGAVAVMLRPDGDVRREATLGNVQRIIADPERAHLAAEVGQSHTFVLGGGGGPRELGVPLTTDMEQIDPERVELPGWYEPDPGRAGDLAFIVFTGEGEGTRMLRITNSRWAMSAFGTASSAALSGNDTVYSVTPLYHPSGLMMSIGGAVAGGSRLALATRFDPDTFWDEARRYGVSVASYTWTMLHSLVTAPPHPGERHHSVRLFIGSGMPVGLWQRVQKRFRPARVLEFYAATEAGAILVNLTGQKPGAMGRPLPGSAEVRIAAYDPVTRSYDLGANGFARPADTGEIGMLLARSRVRDAPGALLRGMFTRGDAWVETHDLFRRDGDGDYWYVDNSDEVIVTESGPVFRGPIRNALGALPGVDLAVAYGVRPDGAEHDLVVAAITLLPDAELHARDLRAALSALAIEQRPDIIHVVDAIPVTTWYRPVTGALRELGVPEPGDQVWALDHGAGGYRRLSAAGYERLTGRPPAVAQPEASPS
jgi:putative long chain acyl-CoA synthase